MPFSRSRHLILDIAQENKWHHRISELKLHLLDTFFVDIYQLQNLTFFGLTLT